MTSRIRLVWTLFIIILLMAAISCTNDMTAGSFIGESDDSTKITSLQTVIDNAQSNSTIDLSQYKDIINYNATVDKALTISKSDDLGGATLTVSADNVKLDGIKNVNVTASSSLANGSLKISGSSLSSLNIQGGGSNSIYLQNGSAVTGQTILNKSVSDTHDEFIRLVLDNTVTVQNLVIKQSSILDADTVVAAANLQNVIFSIDSSNDVAALAINPNITFNRDNSLACVTFINSDESADLMKIFVRKSDVSSIITQRFFVAAFERLVHSLDKDTKTAMFMQLIDILEVPIDNDICLAIEGLEDDEDENGSSSESNEENSSSSSDSSSVSDSSSSSSSSSSSDDSSSSGDDSSSSSTSTSDDNSSSSDSSLNDSSSSSSDSSSSSSDDSSSLSGDDSSSSSDSSSSDSSSSSSNTDLITYTVRFHIGAGSSADDPVEQTMTYGVDAALAQNQFSVENWVFMGWSKTCQSELGEDVTIDYEDGEEVSNLTTIQDDIVNLYAVWDRALIVYAGLTGLTFDKKLYSTKVPMGVVIDCDENNRPNKLVFYGAVPYKWSKDSSETNATSDTDGLANTQSLQGGSNFLAASSSYPMFTILNTANLISSKSDWYLPAKEELLSLQENQDLIDASISAISGGVTISNLTYWSSTQASADTAWTVNVSAETMAEDNKANANYVRPFAVINY